MQEPSDLRSFGRRRGRKHSARQARLMHELLPKLAVDLAAPAPASLAALFPIPVREVWLEIGFGGGEHLVWQATHNPDAGIVGCEPFEDGVVKVLTAIEDRALANIRLHADDARPLLRWLPPSSIDRVFILFPDPWPKRRQAKRRLVNPQLLAQLARIMKAGAVLHVSTDIGDYARTILLAAMAEPRFAWLAASPDDWRRPHLDRPETRYEAKAIREGRPCYHLRFTRI